METASLLLSVSFIYMAYVMYKKNIPIISNFGVYVVFAAMYSFFPTLIYWGIEPELWFKHYELNENELIVGTYISIVSLCNFVFAYIYSKYKKVFFDRNQIYTFKYGDTIVFFVYVLLWAITIYAGMKMGYVSDKTETEHSLVSNLKTLLAGVYIAYLSIFGMRKKLIIMFMLFVFLMLVEQSRWYFFSVFIATVIYLVREKIVKNTTVLLISVIMVLLMSLVGLSRSEVEITDYSLLLNPFYIEGDYGSYMVLQTYYLYYADELKYCTLLLDYITDPLIYMIPRFFFIMLGIDKDDSTLLSMFIDDHQQFLFETYAPVGGFHYLAQASSAIPFVGPILVTALFAKLTVWLESISDVNIRNKLFFYVYTSGFFFVFIKTKFEQTVKYALTLLLPALIIYVFVVNINKYRKKNDLVNDKKGDI